MIHKKRMLSHLWSAEILFTSSRYIDAYSRIYYALYHCMKWRIVETFGSKGSASNHDPLRVQFCDKFGFSEEINNRIEKWFELRKKVDYHSTDEMIAGNDVELRNKYFKVKVFIQQQQQQQGESEPYRYYSKIDLEELQEQQEKQQKENIREDLEPLIGSGVFSNRKKD